jgi:hypothetical protein
MMLIETSRDQEYQDSGLDFKMDSPAVIVGTSSGNWFLTACFYPSGNNYSFNLILHISIDK